MFRKIFLSLLVSLLLLTSSFSFFTRPAKAQENSPWFNQSYSDWFTKVNDSPPSEIFGERYTAAQVQWVFYGFAYFVSNLMGGNNSAQSCILREGKKAEENCKGDITKAISSLSSSDSLASTEKPLNKALSVFSTNPISFVSYVASIREKLSFVPTVHAQGFGFSRLNPVLELWKMTKNVSYFFIAIVVIVFAFMIMFRVKISPQTVITIQSALPKVVIALVLITFSYAIAGLLIDLMYLVIALVAMAFTTLSSGHLSNLKLIDMFNQLVSLNFLSALWNWWWLFMLGSFISIFNVFTNFGIGIPLNIILFLFSILVGLMIFWFMVKIPFMLIKNYVQIILLTVAAPLQILMGTVTPAAGFGSWLKSMLSYLAVYPVVAILLLLSLLFMASGFPDWVTNLPVFDATRGLWFFGFKHLGGTAWDPPLTLGTGMSDLIYLLMSFVLLTMIPKAVEIVQGFIQGKPFAYGTAIGEAIGPIRSVGGQAWGTYGQPIASALRERSANRFIDQLARFIPPRFGGPTGPAITSIQTAAKKRTERFGT